MKQDARFRRVLVIAYDFPPRRTSGVYRTTNLAKCLGTLGWKPTILSVTERPGDLEDRTLLRDFPSEVRIERAKDLNISGWENKAAVGIRAAGGLQSHHKDIRQPMWDRWVRAAGHFVRSTFYFPDDTVGWVPHALTKAIELHMQQRFEVVYTTSPPRAALIVGLLLRTLLRVPWVAEFRDPWYPPERPWRRRFERLLLTRILRRADKVVTVCKGLAGEFEQSYGTPREKLAVVNNGFEERDFRGGDGKPSDLLAPGYFHFCHFGTVYPGFSGRFFDGLKELLQESPDLKGRVRVNVIGFPDEAVRQYAAQSDLEQVVQLHGFVDHAKALAAMQSADCLLLFLGNREVARLAIAGKTYEYLRVGTPILAVTYDGDTTELVNQGRAGWVVNPEDTRAIKEVLRSIVRNGRRENLPRPANPEFVEQFRYDRLAGKMAEILESVVSRGS
jgi:glycosyltransferase involved in cell wall biosynthesis